MNDLFLIVGASGNIGSELVRLLSQQGEKSKTASRHPERLKKLSNAKPVYFDFDDPNSWGRALCDVSHVFMIPKAGDPFPDQTLMPFIDQAKESGVKKIVFSTAMGLDKDWRVLAVAEQHLMRSEIGHTILRPGWFMQNFNPGFLLAAIKSGTIHMPGEACKVSFVDTRDIARVALSALLGDDHSGQVYTLTGSEAITWPQTAEILSNATGRDIRYVNIGLDLMRDGLLERGTQPYRVEQMLQMMQAMQSNLYSDISGDVKMVTGQEPISFSQFAAENADAWKAS